MPDTRHSDEMQQYQGYPKSGYNNPIRTHSEGADAVTVTKRSNTMATPNQSLAARAADLKSVLRDIPGDKNNIDGPVYPIPEELAAAIAAHLAHCGAEIAQLTDRVWVPPERPGEFMNPGSWKTLPVGVGEQL